MQKCTAGTVVVKHTPTLPVAPRSRSAPPRTPSNQHRLLTRRTLSPEDEGTLRTGLEGRQVKHKPMTQTQQECHIDNKHTHYVLHTSTTQSSHTRSFCSRQLRLHHTHNMCSTHPQYVLHTPTTNPLHVPHTPTSQSSRTSNRNHTRPTATALDDRIWCSSFLAFQYLSYPTRNGLIFQPLLENSEKKRCW